MAKIPDKIETWQIAEPGKLVRTSVDVPELEPGEVLVEVGLEIKKKAGIENLFIISLSNDACGYVCHSQAYDEGGYEPGWGTNLAKGAGEIIIKEALDLIKQIKTSL